MLVVKEDKSTFPILEPLWDDPLTASLAASLAPPLLKERFSGECIVFVTGRENDGTELYYYRARYYSPTLQRFLSEDPIGSLGSGVNLYAYVGNNPLSWVDPTGLTTWPTDSRTVTGPFGESRGSGTHTGVDIRNPLGGNVYATDSGTVTEVSSNPRGGNQIIIRNDDGSVSGYAHTDSTVASGQRVNEGQIIGHSDGSGTNAPHLHYTWRSCQGCPKGDPLSHLSRGLDGGMGSGGGETGGGRMGGRK